MPPSSTYRMDQFGQDCSWQNCL